MKPNLFIVGAPKCGTTAWANYLGTHPDIFMSKVKEPHHFTNDLPPDRRITDPAEYLRLFDGSGAARYAVEASPSYLLSQVAAREIREFNPDAKIIILLRNQEDYLPSRHNQFVYNGIENITDFRRAWELSGKRDETNMPPHFTLPRILDYRLAGMFSPQVERYFDQFPAEQIRVFHFRDWTRDPRRTYLEILDFLGLDDDGRTSFDPINPSKHHRGTFITTLVRNPPAPVAATATLLKKVTGRSSLGIANLVYGLDAQEGSLTQIDEVLREEIRSTFKADNARLEPLIWKPRG